MHSYILFPFGRKLHSYDTNIALKILLSQRNTEGNARNDADAA